MKKFFVLVFIIVGITNSYSNISYNNKDTLYKKLYIMKINRTQYAYIIEVNDGENIYNIVSLKTKKEEKCNRIKIGKVYDFIVIKYFKEDYVPNINFFKEVCINDKCILVRCNGCNVFLTPNLSGLCYRKLNNYEK